MFLESSVLLFWVEYSDKIGRHNDYLLNNWYAYFVLLMVKFVEIVNFPICTIFFIIILVYVLACLHDSVMNNLFWGYNFRMVDYITDVLESLKPNNRRGLNRNELELLKHYDYPAPEL